MKPRVAIATCGLLLLGGACGRPQLEPHLTVEPRLEATIEALGEEIARMRLQLDSLATSSDSLRAALSDLQLQLQRVKEIDLQRRRPRASGR